MSTKYAIIDNCIKIASNYDGKVFGGYIRDVIVPKIQDPQCKCQFKDVDIWFKTNIDADMFVNDIKEIYDFQIVPKLSIGDDNPHYEFNRTQYHLFVKNIVIWFDIVITECFLVDDFDVNLLTYCYKDNKELIECQSKCFDKDQLINSINKKKMIILHDYMERLMSKFSSDVHISRINKRFLSRGWIIKYNNIYFPKPLTTLWVNKTFGYINYGDRCNVICVKNNIESSDCSVNFKEQSQIFEDNTQNENNCIIS
jgi:hypothetical protein